LRIRIRDGKKIRIRDEHLELYSKSLETIFGLKIPKFLDADPDPGPFYLINGYITYMYWLRFNVMNINKRSRCTDNKLNADS